MIQIGLKGRTEMMKRYLASGILFLIAGTSFAGGGRVSAAEEPSLPHAARTSNRQTDVSTGALADKLGVEFVKGSTSTVILARGGNKYLIDLNTHEISEVDPTQSAATPTSADAQARLLNQGNGAATYQQKCSACHGADGKGITSAKTPDFTDPDVQKSLTDEQIMTTIRNGKKGTAMPAWASKLSEGDIKAVTGFIRSFGNSKSSSEANGAPGANTQKPKVYQAGDDVLFTLPTGRRLDRHGFYVNFAHRFAFDPAFSGPARGGALFGLDGFAIPSFGFRYGVTDKLSVSVFRAPSIIARPIQFMAAYNLLDEHDGKPLNMAVRFSMEGENNFNKNYTENVEGIFSRSLTSRAQIYFVPTVSFNDRPLQEVSTYSSHDILDLPGHNAVSLGVGGALDIRPTVALVAEVIPTVVNGSLLGIHRPPFSFGIQKKIFRHAFTFGFTTSPGTTVSQRAGTRASFLHDPSADTPSGLFVGFDLTRQIF